MLKLGALGTSLKKVLADRDSVVSRTSIKEICADIDREIVASSLFESVSREKRDRDLNVVQNFKRPATSPQQSLNGKLKDFTKLRQTWRSNVGKEEFGYCSL